MTDLDTTITITARVCGVPLMGAPCQLPAGHDGNHTVTTAAVAEHAQQRLDEHVARRLEAIATVHEYVACPRCAAPRDVRCRHLTRGTELEHPHAARLAAAGIHLR